MRPIPRNSPARLKHADHLALWRAIEGAVIDCFRQHPDYLTERGQREVLRSLVKRAVGSVRSVMADGRVSGCECSGGALNASEPGGVSDAPNGTVLPPQAGGVSHRPPRLP